MPLYNATIIASSQPGTTNGPSPAGPIPAFTPVNATIVDDSAAAIIAQTTALTAELVFIDAVINQINNNISKQVTIQESISKSLSDLEVAFLSLNAVQSQKNVIQSMQTASVVQKGTFDKAVSKEDPVLPTQTEQLEEGVRTSFILNSAATAQGLISTFITVQSQTIISLITGTETYKNIKSWLSKTLDFIKQSAVSLYNKTVDVIKSNVKAIAGDKTI
jgi:hypothetical protein